MGNFLQGNWRKNLGSEVKRIIRSVRASWPETLNLPISKRGYLYELGGQTESEGYAILPASPAGSPLEAKIVHLRYQLGIHADVPVWAGCLVMIGHHTRGHASYALYKVRQIHMDKSSPTIELERMAHTYPRNIDPGFDWLRNIQNLRNLHQLALMTKKKLFFYNCTQPIYVEPFSHIPLNDRQLVYNSFLDELNKRNAIIDSGCHDPVTIKTIRSVDSLQDFYQNMSMLCDRHYNINTNRFVWCFFCCFVNAEKKLAFQGRIFHNNRGHNHPLKLDSVMVEYIAEESHLEEIQDFLSGYTPSFFLNSFGRDAHIRGLFQMLMEKTKTKSTHKLAHISKWHLCTHFSEDADPTNQQGVDDVDDRQEDNASPVQESTEEVTSFPSSVDTPDTPTETPVETPIEESISDESVVEEESESVCDDSPTEEPQPTSEVEYEVEGEVEYEEEHESEEVTPKIVPAEYTHEQPVKEDTPVIVDEVTSITEPDPVTELVFSAMKISADLPEDEVTVGFIGETHPTSKFQLNECDTVSIMKVKTAPYLLADPSGDPIITLKVNDLKNGNDISKIFPLGENREIDLRIHWNEPISGINLITYIQECGNDDSAEILDIDEVTIRPN